MDGIDWLLGRGDLNRPKSIANILMGATANNERITTLRQAAAEAIGGYNNLVVKSLP